MLNNFNEIIIDNAGILSLNQRVLDMLQKKIIEQGTKIEQLKNKIQKQEEELDSLYREKAGIDI